MVAQIDQAQLSVTQSHIQGGPSGILSGCLFGCTLCWRSSTPVFKLWAAATTTTGRR